MRYETQEHLKDTDFKRLTGPPRNLRKDVGSGRKRHVKLWQTNQTGRADQLLMTLTYWREYRTEFHITQFYVFSEATICRTIRKVENALVRSGKFRLPGTKPKTALHWQKEASPFITHGRVVLSIVE